MYSWPVARLLPEQYNGWEAERSALRQFSASELAREVQDGSPARRLAALSLIDLAAVPPRTIEDWITTLPDAEANELAGAIPTLRPYASCADETRWVRLARAGYDRRALPTFLVMLFHAHEALEAASCSESPIAWEETADWLVQAYTRLSVRADHEAMDDVALFVFENYLDRAAIFEAFCTLLANDRTLALKVSANPALFLSGLESARQQAAISEAERGGGLPAVETWRLLGR